MNTRGNPSRRTDSARVSAVSDASLISSNPTSFSPINVSAGPATTTATSPQSPTSSLAVAKTVLDLTPEVMFIVGEFLAKKHATLGRVARVAKHFQAGLFYQLHRTKVWQSVGGTQEAERWKVFVESAEAKALRSTIISVVFWSKEVAHLLDNSAGAVMLLHKNFKPADFDDTFHSLTYLVWKEEGRDANKLRWGTEATAKAKLSIVVSNCSKEDTPAVFNLPTSTYGMYEVAVSSSKSSSCDPAVSLMAQLAVALSHIKEDEGQSSSESSGESEDEVKSESSDDCEYGATSSNKSCDEDEGEVWKSKYYSEEDEYSSSSSKFRDEDEDETSNESSEKDEEETTGKLIVNFISWEDKGKAVVLVKAMADISPLALCTNIYFEMGDCNHQPGPNLDDGMKFLGLFKEVFMDVFRLTEGMRDMSLHFTVHGPDESKLLLEVTAVAGTYGSAKVSATSNGWGTRWPTAATEKWEHKVSQCKVKEREIKL
ncbi:hypothetical protein QFC22_006191 [Naganishia vaughanmartiniae]|uniref:Uncharacterized protein n=1 Tax=Naganishia vaughanmartiniae TaxID=1424756 RepID=A0ACC2WLR1_9TREE|nr:hypothetical protein QFC22_006191 [Naganishia vaughanmartiniae]